MLSAKESEAVGDLVCEGLTGLHLLSQCKLFIPKAMLDNLSVMKTVFQSEVLSVKTCRECFSSALESVCIPACLLDIPAYPAYEQLLGPVVILGLGSFELFFKEKKMYMYKFFL